MLGIPSPSIFLAYLLSVLSAVACVIYGIVNWNKGGEEEVSTPEDRKWVEEEKAVEEAL